MSKKWNFTENQPGILHWQNDVILQLNIGILQLVFNIIEVIYDYKRIHTGKIPYNQTSLTLKLKVPFEPVRHMSFTVILHLSE